MEENGDEQSSSASQQKEDNKVLNECALCQIKDAGELLNCKTCNSSQEKNDFLCDACICHHVRRGHEVVDQRGYEMSICASHKMINDLFCVQCSQVVCNKCILNHRGHDYITAAEKRVETRKEIFELISKFEILNKDIKFHQLMQKDCSKEKEDTSVICNPTKTVDILAEIIGNYLRRLALSDAHLSKIDELAKIFGDNNLQAAMKAEKHDSLVDESDSMVASLRENLQKSDGALVGSFVSAVEDMNRSLDDQNASLKEFVSFKPFHIGGQNLESFANQFLNEFLNMMRWPDVVYQTFEIVQALKSPHYHQVEEEKTEQRVICPSERGYFGVLDTHEEKLLLSLIQVYTEQVTCHSCLRISNGYNYNGHGGYCGYCGYYNGIRVVLLMKKDTQIAVQNFTKVQEVKNLSQNSNLMYFALLFFDKVSIVHASEPLYVNATVATSEPFPDIIPTNCLFFYCCPNFNVLIWDPFLKVIRPFKQDPSVKNVTCTEKPDLFTCNLNMNLFAITVSSSENIIIISNDISTQLTPAIHGLQRVDALFLTEIKILLGWNLRRKICVAFRECLQGSASKWFAIKAFQPQLNEMPEEYNESKWNRIEHTQSHVYIFISRVSVPWILPMHEILGKLPPS